MIGVNQKLYTIILFSLLGISGLFFILFLLGIEGEREEFLLNLILNWCFLLFGIATLAAVVFPVLGMLKDFKKAKGSIIGVALLVVFFIIGFVLSTEETYTIGESVIEGMTSKYSEAGLITFYIMIVLAIAVIIYTEISKAFK